MKGSNIGGQPLQEEINLPSINLLYYPTMSEDSNHGLLQKIS